MTVFKKDLSPGRQRLILLCQQLNFGRVCELRIENGEPLFEPPPSVVHDWKLDGDCGSRAEITFSDFALKQQHQRLLEAIDAVGDGMLDEIHIRSGLPCRLIFSRKAA